MLLVLRILFTIFDCNLQKKADLEELYNCYTAATLNKNEKTY